LGFFCKPIIILNTDNYYDEMLSFLDKMIAENFMHQEHRKMWQTVSLPCEVLPAISASFDWNRQSIEFAVIEK
jgi:predicted Rossmann-fold nucleotide-binding protein